MNLGGISIPSQLVGYAVGLDSQIYKTIDGGGPPFTSSVRNSPPCDCNTTLTQHPLDQSVELHFDAVATQSEIDLYDLLGRKLGSITVEPNRNSITIDISKYTSGVYLARYRGRLYRFVKV